MHIEGALYTLADETDRLVAIVLAIGVTRAARTDAALGIANQAAVTTVAVGVARWKTAQRDAITSEILRTFEVRAAGEAQLGPHGTPRRQPLAIRGETANGTEGGVAAARVAARVRRGIVVRTRLAVRCRVRQRGSGVGSRTAAEAARIVAKTCVRQQIERLVTAGEYGRVTGGKARYQQDPTGSHGQKGSIREAPRSGFARLFALCLSRSSAGYYTAVL